MADGLAQASLLDAADGVPLKTRLRRAERRRKVKAFALVAPLMVFLAVTFAAPIGVLLYRSIENPEVAATLPRMTKAIGAWDGQGLPGEAVYRALATDLVEARKARTLAVAAKRLNYEIVGFRSLLFHTARKLPTTEGASAREKFLAIDARWGQRAYWATLKRGAAPYTAFYLLASVDRALDADDHVVKVPAERALYVNVFGRTFWMALVVTAWCFILGYPVAYLLGTLPTRHGNLLMILVLLPFWTSLLVRTAAWVVVLQKEGMINDLMVWLGLVPQPVQLVFNRIGVYIAMVHILLPFMILPLYSVMKGIPPTTMRAAASLGANPFVAFFRVYLPQTLPGVGAGCLLVYILAIGYYITPALLGGPRDQMVSYFVAYYTNTTINWGMAAALGAVLFALTLLLYAVYDRLVGIERMKLG